jgi:SAM-dependent methyltransferase
MATSGARSCPACLGAGAPAGEADGFALLRCRSCKTLFTGRVPEAAEALDYDAYYHAGNLAVPEFVRGRLEETVGSFERYRRVNAWLDVGCGAGTLLEAAQARGWEATGTEVAQCAAEAVRAKGFDVRVGELPESGLAEAGFDVVSMVEVVEHVPEPRRLVAEAAALVRPGGALYITTPHGRGLSARVLGSDWSVVAPPEHLQLFSVPGLRDALTAAGLRVRRVRTQGVNPHELARRWRRPSPDAAVVSRVESGYKLNEALVSTRRGTVVKNAANIVLSATRLGDTIRLVGERPQ